MKDKKFFVFGLITGILTASLFVKFYDFFKKQPKQFIIDKEQSLKDNGFCFCKDIQNEVNISNTNKIALRNLDGGQSFVDVVSIYNVDEQQKLMNELFASTKHIKTDSNDNKNMWVVSDIHGDIQMLIEGLLKSGLITWNGKTKIETYNAYNNKTFKIVYPDVQINQNFKGKYINLGDIVNKHAFGMTSLYLLHDIFEKTKNKDGSNNKVKIVIGNHEYADITMKGYHEYSPYRNPLINFIDMFVVYYENDGISFTHAPMCNEIKPSTKKEVETLNKQILNDKDGKIKRFLWGAGEKTFGYLISSLKTSKPSKIASCNVSGHTHGPINFGYNKRTDVLNLATDRFNKDKTKIGVIFKINTAKKEVYSYTKDKNGDIIRNKLEKNLFDCK